MASVDGASPPHASVAPQAVLFDLLMAVMNSLETWSSAAGAELGLAWRDSATARMRAAGAYVRHAPSIVNPIRRRRGAIPARHSSTKRRADPSTMR